jgi:hypothetical protein
MWHGWRRGMHTGYWCESQKKRTTRKTRHMWVDNIKMALRETECGGMDWIDLTQDRNQWMVLVKTVMNLLVPQMLRSF